MFMTMLTRSDPWLTMTGVTRPADGPGRASDEATVIEADHNDPVTRDLHGHPPLSRRDRAHTAPYTPRYKNNVFS